MNLDVDEHLGHEACEPQQDNKQDIICAHAHCSIMRKLAQIRQINDNKVDVALWRSSLQTFTLLFLNSNAIMKAARNNMLGAGTSNNKVKYSRLAADDDGYIDLQFKKSPPKVPYKAIALAIFLFLIGSLLITFGALLLSGTIHVEHPDRTIPVIIIGLLVFLPGFYHLRIAYYAAKGYRGYSYDDIPDFGD
ncbi:Transmembrane protein 230 [Larimichthys crocea]|uniref:Uncharacterized protein n=1 Tax=Larimichthys crocea TaxID=215358 RepID=A0ACD3QN22_LARCR|nr:Transmembrane protein 230 [Larimichthys crocea]